MSGSKAKPLKIKSWDEYVRSDALKDEKLSALMKNLKVLFADPGQNRGGFWKSLLPKAVEYKFNGEYQKAIEDFTNIEIILGPTLLSKIKSDVENAFAQFKKQKNLFRVDDVVKIVSIFTNSRKGMNYHEIWSILASVFSTFSDNKDTYVFLGQSVKFLFPLKAFSIDKHFQEKRIDKNEFRSLYTMKFPKIDKSLTLRQFKTGVDPKFIEKELSESDYIQNKVAFEAFIDHIYEDLIMKCFWNQLKPENFLKLIDLTMVYGVDFIKRIAYQYLKEYEIKLNNAIKRSSKGIKQTPSSLVFIANSVINETLHNRMNSSNFKSLALDIINNKDDRIYEEKWKNKILFDALIEETIHTSSIVIKKIDQVNITKKLLSDSKISLNEVELGQLFLLIDQEANNLKKKV